MLLDDHEQKLSTNTFQPRPIGLSRASIRRDESSEIAADMTRTLHVNTPEQTLTDIDNDDDDEIEKNDGDKQELIEQLQAQLIHNQLQRTQARNYTRILRQSNTPARWYKALPINRSVYFYDPNYQKYIQQQTTSPPKSISTQPQRIQEHFANHSNIAYNNPIPFTPRTKYILNLYATAVNYHQQKQCSNENYRPNAPRSHPSRLPLIPTLPPINSSQQGNEHEYKVSNQKNE